jgi:hypothetical protein
LLATERHLLKFDINTKGYFMRIITVLLTLVILSSSFATKAEPALSKELVTSFQQVSQQWEALEKNFPELSSALDSFDLSQLDQITETIKNSAAYPKVKAVLANSSFKSVEEYMNVAMRLMGGMVSHQMEKMPEMMDAEKMSSMLKGSIDKMKANNVPKEMVVEMEKQLADIEKNMQIMQSAITNTSAADKKFFKENAQWVMSTLNF